MVRFTVHHLGEHVIENMTVTGPCSDIILQMANIFLAGYNGPEEEMDYHFAKYIISFSHGQGEILEYRPSPPATRH